MDDAGGTIFDIQRFSIHDGPGIRTTVFLKGCPLNCMWCHNPESISPAPQLSYLPDRCIGCGRCAEVCRTGAHTMRDGLHVFDRSLCEVCGRCAAQCYAGALELVGRQATVAEIVEEVLRDEAFYETSGGGVTLSGGEPMLQVDFTDALLRACKAEGLHTCLDTSGFAPMDAYRRVMPHVDIFLFDLKETDDDRHRKFTGVSNRRLLANLRALHEEGARIRLRLPLIPGANDRDEHFRAVARIVESLPNLLGVDVMAYHKLGVSKLDRFGLARPFATEPPDDDTKEQWVQRFADLGVTVHA